MNLDLSHGIKVSDVQKQFSEFFPFLKIELFRHPHRPQQASPAEDLFGAGTYLHDIRPNAGEQVFEFNGAISVAEFEQRLQNEFGLPVQVFRRSGNVWLETIQTDKLSLQKQNALGERTTLKKPSNFYTLFL